MHGAAQDVTHTASRRSGPRKWLRAVEWLVGAGLHPKANATTLKVAEDLAARMDYDTGHARYCMLETADRLGVDKATVKRHVKYLRELGALAWVQHGTRANIRRALGMKGYAATATVYAAVIPPCYDHAMGRTIVGSGYTARVIVDQRGQAKPVDNCPVDNPSSEGLAPPSLTGVKEESQVQIVGGFNYTSRSSDSKASPRPHHRTTSSNSQTPAKRRTPAQVRWEIQQTRTVRALVNWTQRERLRRLAVVLRPFFDRGLGAHEIAAELLGMVGRWRPRRPGDFIEAALAREVAADTERKDQQRQQEALEAAATEPTAEFAAARQVLKARDKTMVEYPSIEEVGLSRAEVEELRENGRKHPSLVVQYAEMAGEAAAVALYGRMMVDHAHRLVAA